MTSTISNRLNGLTTSVAVKAPCRVATTANITLSGLQSIDGVTVVAGDRVLVKDQTDASENGIWKAASGAWTRATDFDGSFDFVKGTLVSAHSGATNNDTFWRVTTADGAEVGADDIEFEAALGFNHSADYVAVEDFGATGTPGTNDQPAIQDAIDFAVSAGIQEVRFNAPAYEVWCPERTSLIADGIGTGHTDGIPFVITGDVALISPAGTTLTLKGPDGTSNRLQNPGDGSWYGLATFFYTGSGVTYSRIRGITVLGGYSYSVGTGNSQSNIYDKCFAVFDGYTPNLVVVDHRDCTFSGFRGEIWYMGGDFTACTATLVDVTLNDSAQACFNPGGTAVILADRLRAYNAYQVAEGIIGPDSYFTDCDFYLAASGCGLAGTTGVPSDYYFSYPYRDTSLPPPWVTFNNCTFRTIGGYVSLGSWSRGKITIVDSQLSIPNYGWTRDIDLDVDFIADKNNNSNCVGISGPADLTTQVPNCPVGVFYKPPQNISIRARMLRTQYAIDAGYKWASAVVVGGIAGNAGLYDHDTIVIELTGYAKSGYALQGTPVANFALPLIKADLVFAGRDQATGYKSINASGAITIDREFIWLDLGAGGPYALTIDTTYAYCGGQRVTIYHNSNAGRTVTIAKNATGVFLNSDLTLDARGEYIVLEYDNIISKWVEVARMAQS